MSLWAQRILKRQLNMGYFLLLAVQIKTYSNSVVPGAQAWDSDKGMTCASISHRSGTITRISTTITNAHISWMCQENIIHLRTTKKLFIHVYIIFDVPESL